MIPILIDHDANDIEKVIGKVEPNPTGGLRVMMRAGHELREDQVYSIFGNVGFTISQVIEKNDKSLLIREFIIKEFSLGR